MKLNKNNLIFKYGINSESEINCLKKLILEMKKIEKDETLFTISYYSKIPPNRAKRVLKYNREINIYEVEIADDESTTEYYFLDLNSLEDMDDDIDENNFRLFLLGEISPLEIKKLCKLPDEESIRKIL